MDQLPSTLSTLRHRPRDRVRRRLVVTLAIGLGALPAAAFVGITLYSGYRLDSALAGFREAFGSDDYARLAARVDPGRTTLAQHVVAAAQATNLTHYESGRLDAHANGKMVIPPPDLAQLRTLCRAALATIGSAAEVPRGLGRPATDGLMRDVRQRWPEGATPTARTIHTCGLEAIQRGDRATAIDAAALLGVLAEGLQRRPVRLDLMMGRHAEARQRDLIARLGVTTLTPAEAARLLAALPARAESTPRRELLAGDALTIVRRPRDWNELETRLHAAAYLHQLRRLLVGDRRGGGWLDRLLMHDDEIEHHLKKEQARMEDHLRRREEMRRALTLAAL